MGMLKMFLSHHRGACAKAWLGERAPRRALRCLGEAREALRGLCVRACVRACVCVCVCVCPVSHRERECVYIVGVIRGFACSTTATGLHRTYRNRHTHTHTHTHTHRNYSGMCTPQRTHAHTHTLHKARADT